MPDGNYSFYISHFACCISHYAFRIGKARGLLVVFGFAADGLEEAEVGVAKGAVAAGHHTGGDVNKFLHRQVGEAGGATLREAGHEIAREA